MERTVTHFDTQLANTIDKSIFYEPIGKGIPLMNSMYSLFCFHYLSQIHCMQYGKVNFNQICNHTFEKVYYNRSGLRFVFVFVCVCVPVSLGSVYLDDVSDLVTRIYLKLEH